MNSKKISIILGLSLTLFSGIAIGHGFPTFWEYIESLSGDYISDESSRNEILNSNITDGELLKAKSFNAKFNSLNYEINDLNNRINSLESSLGNVEITEHLGCGDTCYAFAYGIAEGEDTPREFLVSLNSTSMKIVTRGGTPNSSLAYATNFSVDSDDGHYSLTTSQSGEEFPLDSSHPIYKARIVRGDFTFKKCNSNNCYGNLRGIAEGQNTEKEYLVRLSSTSSLIVFRGATINANLIYATNFNTNIYSTSTSESSPDYEALEASRVKASEFEFIDCDGTNCYGILNGVAEGQSTAKDYLVRISSTESRIAYKGGVNNLNTVYTNSFSFDSDDGHYASTTPSDSPDNLKLELSRVKRGEFNFHKCSNTECFLSIYAIAEGETEERNFLSRISSTELRIVSRGGTSNLNTIYANSFSIDSGGEYTTTTSESGLTFPLDTNHPIYKGRVLSSDIDFNVE